MYDRHSEVSSVPAINPGATITGNSTTNSAIIDRAGFGEIEFLIQSGAVTDGTQTPSITEGDAANLSDGAAVTGNLLGTVAAATFTGSGDANKTKRIGYKGDKRYLRLTLTQSGATSGGIYCAQALLGKPSFAPQP